MADMTKIVGAVIAITVSVIVISSVLAPTIADATGSGGALEEWKSLLSAIIVLAVVGTMMVAVKLISNKN